MMWSGVWERSSVWHLIPVGWRRLVHASGSGLSQALARTQQRLSALITVKHGVGCVIAFIKIWLLQENDANVWNSTSFFEPGITGCYFYLGIISSICERLRAGLRVTNYQRGPFSFHDYSNIRFVGLINFTGLNKVTGLIIFLSNLKLQIINSVTLFL